VLALSVPMRWSTIVATRIGGFHRFERPLADVGSMSLSRSPAPFLKSLAAVALGGFVGIIDFTGGHAVNLDVGQVIGSLVRLQDISTGSRSSFAACMSSRVVCANKARWPFREDRHPISLNDVFQLPRHLGGTPGRRSEKQRQGRSKGRVSAMIFHSMICAPITILKIRKYNVVNSAPSFGRSVLGLRSGRFLDVYKFLPDFTRAGSLHT
jgi:hypothetical protein